jgi:hypothetical protein
MFETAKTAEDYEREAKVANDRKVASLISDLRQIRDLSRHEARYLTSMYYAQQEERIRNYARAQEFGNSPTITLMGRSAELFEDETKKALDRYSKSHPIGRWMRSITGIGPVMAAGLLGFVDINICNTAGKLWSYAGLRPSSAPRKGEKIQYNPKLKKLCYLIGESFIKVSGKEDALYGRLYKEKKAYYQAKNDAGDYAARAADILAKYNYGKDTEAYKYYIAGRLPPAHIHAMARRWAVVIFLSHLQEVWFRYEFNKEPPAPYVMAHLGHVDYIPPPAFTEEHLTGKKVRKGRGSL